MELLIGLGKPVLSVWQYLAEFVALLRRTVASGMRIRRHNFPVIARVTMQQIFFTGFQAVLPLTLAAIALGTLVLSIALEYLPVDYVQGVASIVITREVVPLVTAFLIIGRSGTAITIEVGNMKLNDELDALAVMGIPMEQYVALPRWIGAVAAFLFLQIYANLFGLVGGYYTAALADWTLPVYPVADLLQGIEPGDFFVACLKAVFFGTVISLTAIQHGLHVEHSRREIPIATSRAVVRSLLLCFLLNTAVSLSA